ncbi:MAG: diaminopropionate ammonia-lyase [Deltaproteobacteria bacterium]|nr:diaminopropionate ammonia-lyase [Deltaproteobacteria bacterium]MBW1930816.1 diaminopropionate ammonia-lyase [Deltaproteobacteria bacterium]MBW2024703.1 diaminopropionate ammonia-lyase [Deltaproteobacteria bacterium]MBW2125492.1 diaminopropionate ammonia-lyase [Deltaproteobacteria bacterium]
MSGISFHINNLFKRPGEGANTRFLDLEAAEKARGFHATFKEYQRTPFIPLPNLARHLGIGQLFIKDESYRFGLNAFKVLGASYAIAQYLAHMLGRDVSEVSGEKLRSPYLRKKLGKITFATATDGNHGRAVAWTAQQLGQRSVVYMPKGSDPVRLENIRVHGAEASITEFNYDETVRMTFQVAQDNGWVVVQDTAWPGYEDIPRWIMQGYTTLALEFMEQLQEQGIYCPTHIFLQAGVGSFAASVLGFLASYLGDDLPATVIVEPDTANCIYRSAKIDNGKPHAVKGDLKTIMAGLACGEPNIIGWEILRDYARAYVSCPDWVAANGMRILAAPLRGDTPIISGESGAVTCGVLEQLMVNPDYAEIRAAIGLNSKSVVVLISTEGDTSPPTYRDIVWYGKHSPFSSNLSQS